MVKETASNEKPREETENSKVKPKMEWLQPHISRINNFCSSQTYLSNGKPLGKKTGYYGDVYDGHDITEQLLKYQQFIELSREKIRQKDLPQPVSVIVTEKSRSGSLSSSVPSPTSTISESIATSSENSNTSVTEDNVDVEENKDDNDYEENIDDDNCDESASKKAKIEYNYKPVPMVRKSRRNFIANDLKDESYWERRRRNNAAAKKSRESRREKEIEVNVKCANLEKENNDLKEKIINVQERNSHLETTMQMYKEILIKNNLL